MPAARAAWPSGGFFRHGRREEGVGGKREGDQRVGGARGRAADAHCFGTNSMSASFVSQYLSHTLLRCWHASVSRPRSSAHVSWCHSWVLMDFFGHPVGIQRVEALLLRPRVVAPQLGPHGLLRAPV